MVGSFYGRSIDLYSTEGVYFFLIFFLYFRSSFFYIRFFFSESVEFSEEILTPAGWLTCQE